MLAPSPALCISVWRGRPPSPFPVLLCRLAAGRLAARWLSVLSCGQLCAGEGGSESRALCECWMRVSVSTLSPTLLQAAFLPGHPAQELGAVGSAWDSQGAGQGPAGASAGDARCQAAGAPSLCALLAPLWGPTVPCGCTGWGWGPGRHLRGPPPPSPSREGVQAGVSRGKAQHSLPHLEKLTHIQFQCYTSGIRCCVHGSCLFAWQCLEVCRSVSAALRHSSYLKRAFVRTLLSLLLPAGHLPDLLSKLSLHLKLPFRGRPCGGRRGGC